MVDKARQAMVDVQEYQKAWQEHGTLGRAKVYTGAEQLSLPNLFAKLRSLGIDEQYAPEWVFHLGGLRASLMITKLLC